jgi:hypothetical protein
MSNVGNRYRKTGEEIAGRKTEVCAPVNYKVSELVKWLYLLVVIDL